MSFPSLYRDHLLRAVHSIEAAKVDQAIAWMADARDAGRAIFVAEMAAVRPPRRILCAIW